MKVNIVDLVYLTRNLINQKIYVGVHSQKESGYDGYLGSGTILSRAKKKYGKENFVRETLRICGSSWEAYQLEALIVDENFVKRNDTYNQKVGGFGGFPPNNPGRKGTINSEETREKMSKAHIGILKGTIATDETRLILSKAAKARKCNVTGTKWISKDGIRKRVIEIERFLNEGWKRGQNG